MQMIKTKYLSPTTHKGARIKATTSMGKSKTISYPYELSGSDCHAQAVKELAQDLEWHGDMIFDCDDKGCVFMFNDLNNTITL